MALQQQLRLRDEVIKAYDDYDKGRVSRDPQSLKTFLVQLNETWDKFDQGHDDVAVQPDVDLTHEYFTKDQHGALKGAIDNIRSRIAARLSTPPDKNTNPGTPKDDPKQSTSASGSNGTDKKEAEKAKESMERIFADIGRNSELDKLKALYNTKIEILRSTMEKTQTEQNIGAIYLQQKIKSLEAQWKSLTTIADEILKVENSANVLQKIMDAQEQFDTGLTAIQEKARNVEQVKLPPVNIPCFDGTYGAWNNFRSSFETAVHSNTGISNVQKMQHLKANTKGAASKIIRHLAITSDNYETAWEILRSRFDHERKLVRTYYETARNIEKIEKPTAKSLRDLHDVFIESLSSLNNMGFGETDDHWVVNFIIDKLDDTTLRAFERAQKEPRKFPTLDALLKFIDERADSLEAFKVGNESSTNRNEYVHKNEREEKQFNGKGKKQCYECKGEHGLFNCDKFKTCDVNKRWETIKKHKLCAICFGKHFTKECKSKYRCGQCQGQHSQLLHNEARKEKTMISANTTRTDQSEVFLGTALVKCKTKQGDYIILRALIDEGSQGTFMTERAAQLLQLKRERVSATVDGFGDKSVTQTTTMLKLEVKSIHDTDFYAQMNVLVTKKITKILPSVEVPIEQYTHLKNIQLADPEYYKPAPIDMSIGSDHWTQFALEGLIKAGPEKPYAHQSELGWIVLGKSSLRSASILSMVTNVDIENSLKEFWKVESVGELDPRAIDEDECERFFKENHTRDENGRYIVAIPFKNSIKQLGKSRNMAVAQMLQLEKKFKADHEYKKRYVDCINEYIELGHMIPVESTENEMITGIGNEIQYNTAYLPHHAVIKESSTTTKLRVVFDASRKTSTGISLNETMMIGPTIQEDIQSILMRWRKYPIAFCADIRKMYRQVWVRLQDAEFQRMVWRDAEDKPIRDYKLMTVTFGTASAPYLATRVLHQVGIESEKTNPRAAEIIKDDTYMDDSCAGAWNVREGIHLQREIKQILAESGFDLRKWASNDIELLMAIPKEDREVQPEEFYSRDTLKILGLPWKNSDDFFTYKYEIKDEEESITKRKFLKVTAALFDPIGWLSPLTAKIKMLYQQIWADGIDWDEPIGFEVQKEWNELKKQAYLINEIKVPRWIGMNTAKQQIQLHGFSDASMKGIAACVYTRIVDDSGNVKVTLLAAKNRVAPRDKKGKTEITLPRLELCGAHLLALLLQKAILSLKCENVQYFTWSDSMITLAWIKNSTSRWKTFVNERVKKIREVTGADCWRYVPTKENPSDLASRGLLPAELKESELWWKGPEWLQKSEEHWPKQPTQFGTIEEMQSNHSTNTTIVNTDFFQQFTSWKKLQKTIALCMRFADNCKRKERNAQHISTIEIRMATIRIIQNTQEMYFKEEIQQLKTRGTVSSASRIANLNPFLDENGIIRVGGRLKNATMPYMQKHPMVLPKEAHISRLIVDDAHIMTIHGAESNTLAFIRYKYWIIGGGSLVKNRLKSCIRCARVRATGMKQMMADLPMPRVNVAKPFEHTGVDYAGPFNIRTSKGRGHKTYKGYISLFICLATKAMHLEAVSDLKSTGFIAAFKRFAARRGTPAHMYSDNGTNFCAANKFLQAQDKEEQTRILSDLSNEMVKKGTQWHFNPPAAPHFGGLWEAGVKSVKTHLTKTQVESFTFEEFTTLLSQIEANLNSRPLCPMSNDPDDLRILTPGHFLIGAALVAPPDESDSLDNINDLTRWQLVQRKNREFWHQWRQEYLTRMQQRPKWLRKRENLEVGDMVMINEPNTPPTRWVIGRIKDVHPGSDGMVRVATIRTPDGICKRPVVKLCLLPTQRAMEFTMEPQRCVAHGSDDSNGSDENSTVTVDKAKQCNSGTNDSAKTARNNKKKCYAKKNLSGAGGNGNRNTRTRYNLRSMLVLVIFGIICAMVGAKPIDNTNEKPFTVEKFENQPGIYFEEMGHAKLINDKWHLIVYYKLDQYFWQAKTLNILESQMRGICSDMLTRGNYSDDYSTCISISGQISSHLTEIHEKNRIFYMGKTEKATRRRKRGLIDGIGMVANEVFGVLDSRFAERYEKDIRTAEQDREHILRLIRNQTLVFDATANLMKKTQRDSERQFHQVGIVIKQIGETWNETNMELAENRRMQAFLQLALQMTIILGRYEHMQDILIDLVTDTHQGHTNPMIIPPEQLQGQVMLIQANLPSDIKLPGGSQHIDLLRLYSSMTVRTALRNEMLIFDIRLPLINNNEYQIFKLYPLPVKHNNEMLAIRPSTEYLLINLKRDLYQAMTGSEFERCIFEHQGYYCDHRNILLKPESGKHLCEVKLLLHQTLEKDDCRYVRQTGSDYWLQLNEPNKWIYSVSASKTVVIICNNQPYHQELIGEGIITINQRCSIQTPDLQIQSGFGGRSELTRSYLPTVNITEKLASDKSMRRTEFPKVTNIQSTNHIEEIEDLQTKITQMNQEFEEAKTEHVGHRNKNYAAIFILTVIFCAFGLYRIYKRVKPTKKDNTVFVVARKPSVQREAENENDE